MKKFSICINILIFCIFASPVSGQTLDSLANAKQAYEQADYESAVEYFELTVSGGIYNAEILYNLGNTYFQNNALGYALLYYQRAMILNPRDLDTNIQIARVRTLRNTLQTEANHPIIIIEQITSSIVTITELSILTFIIWNITWISAVIIQVQKKWRRQFKLVTAILSLISIIFISLLAVRLYVYHQMPMAVVVSQTAPTYTGANISYFEQYQLSEASEIYITEERDEWYKFVTGDSQQGWIEADHIVLIPIN